MSHRQAAYTKGDIIYPGYVNLSENEDGSFTLYVRSDPTTREGIHICGYAQDRGLPGRCTPGDEHCNNYCNMAPEKGPMAPRAKPAKPATHVDCGTTSAIRLTGDEVQHLLGLMQAIV